LETTVALVGKETGETSMIYQIKVKGTLDPSWSDWLGSMEVAVVSEDGVLFTLLTGTIADQSALFGVLERIRDMNLLPISVERVDEER
jgi:hypothetical protein